MRDKYPVTSIFDRVGHRVYGPEPSPVRVSKIPDEKPAPFRVRSQVYIDDAIRGDLRDPGFVADIFNRQCKELNKHTEHGYRITGWRADRYDTTHEHGYALTMEAVVHSEDRAMTSRMIQAVLAAEKLVPYYERWCLLMKWLSAAGIIIVSLLTITPWS